MDAIGFHPRPVPAALRVAAAERLVEATGQAARQLARRLVDGGAGSAIVFDHAFATIDPDRGDIREVAVAIPAAGRSVLVFLSRPASRRDHPRERAECVRALCEHLQTLPGGPFHIAQSLPATTERWAVEALLAAGWSIVGELAYMRRPLGADDLPRRRKPSELQWPDGVEIEPLGIPGPGEPAPPALIAALDDSYIDTLDCPDLCGMRDTGDIVASHAAIGRSELALWSLLRHEGRPAGALLLACLPDQRCYELVYIGLGPSLRGKGLGEALLRHALGVLATRIRQGQHRSGWSITCAVDTANVPAVRVYERLGFMPFDRRVACVQRLRPEREHVVHTS